MMYLEPEGQGKVHARTFSERTGEDGQEYETWCGRWMTGRRGESVVTFINCKSCQRILRRNGWNV